MRIHSATYQIRIVFAAISLAVACCLPLVPRAIAQEDVAATVDAPRFSLADVAFITGHWGGELFGGRTEEVWMAPDGGTMVGTFRLMYGEKTRVIEFLMVTQTAEGVVFRFKHFSDEYRAWEQDQPLTFNLIEASDNYAVFESNVQDKPKRMVYRLRDDGSLSVLVESEENGESESFDAVYTRADG